jgi:hypothetical protein
MHNRVQWGWLSAEVVVAAIVVATLSYYFFEAPIIRWARGLERRPPKVAALSEPVPT